MENENRVGVVIPLPPRNPKRSTPNNRSEEVSATFYAYITMSEAVKQSRYGLCKNGLDKANMELNALKVQISAFPVGSAAHTRALALLEKRI